MGHGGFSQLSVRGFHDVHLSVQPLSGLFGGGVDYCEAGKILGSTAEYLVEKSICLLQAYL